jgi:hypothetical protein
MTMPSMPAPPVRVSPIDAAQQAVEHTRRFLFPFRFERWLALGFVAFLEQCGRGGGGGSSFRFPGPGVDTDTTVGNPAAEVSRVVDWLGGHVVVVAIAAAFLLALIVALTALVLWVGSRAIFVYMDDVATGRADVRRPWREHAEAASSLFAWRFVIGLATLLGVLFIVLLGGVLVFAAWKGRLSGGVALAIGLLALLPSFLALVVASALVSVALRDFVAPLQWRHGIPCGDALRTFSALLRANPGPFALYVLLKIAFALVAGIVVLVAGCLTCCCAFLPVVSQTALQPLFYFERSWSLCFLRQLGHDVIRAAPVVTGPPTEPASEAAL